MLRRVARRARSTARSTPRSKRATMANFFTPENAVEAFSFLAAYRRNQAWLLEVPPPQPVAGSARLGPREQIRERAEPHCAVDDSSAADVGTRCSPPFGIDASAVAIVRNARGSRVRGEAPAFSRDACARCGCARRRRRNARFARAVRWRRRGASFISRRPKGVRTVRGAHALVRRGHHFWPGTGVCDRRGAGP